MVSVSLEKQQVAALAERVDDLLDQLMGDSGVASVIPAVAPIATEDSEPLDQPIEEEFRGGTMTLSWDPDDERVVIEVFPVTDDLEVDLAAPEDEEDEPEEVFVVRLPAPAARAFAKRASRVVGAGRPSCPFCGNPVSPDGHLCVRANGFRRREP